MQEIAKKLDITDTEACRQIKRLSEARLVEKQPDGNYAITEYCKLVLQLSPTLEFVYKYREYFLSRDISQLPYEFINRIGELSSGILGTNVADTINHAEQMIKQAEEYMWTLRAKV